MTKAKRPAAPPVLNIEVRDGSVNTDCFNHAKDHESLLDEIGLIDGDEDGVNIATYVLKNVSHYERRIVTTKTEVK